MINQQKELYFVKIKSAQANNDILIKRSIDYSYFSDFNLFISLIKSAILNLEKNKKLEEYIIVLILNHPILKDIFIYSKEQWQLYYNFNIIDQCINNKNIKVKYDLLDKGTSLHSYKKNKKNVIKYIMKNMNLSLFSKIFFKFLKEYEDISKKFQFFFIQELLNEVPEKNKNKKIRKKSSPNSDDDLDLNFNLNINNLINNEDKEGNSDGIKDSKKSEEGKLYPKLDKEYLLHTIEFLNTLEEKFKNFSEKEKNMYKIKDILGEEEENDKIEKNKNIEDKTSIKMNLEDSFGNLSLLEYENNDSISKDNNVLLTVLTPPANYVKKLLNDDNFFKNIEKEEYYLGIEQFKDDMNRQLVNYSEYFLNQNQ